jgi:subtilase family serine protease
VSATVANDGSRPAYGVTVAVLLPGGESAAQQVLPVLEAGHKAQVLLAVPGTGSEKLTLKVDPQDQAVETNEQDNQADVGAASHGAPGLPFALLAAVVLVAASRRRRTRL